VLGRIHDWERDQYDFAFRTGARQARFSREDEGADAGMTTDLATGAVAVLARLWCPTRIEVALGPLDGRDQPAADGFVAQFPDDPDPVALVGRLAADLRAALEERAGWGPRMIGLALEGWARIALPAEADDTAPWLVASDEGHLQHPLAARSGAPEAGLRTVWLRFDAPTAASDLEVTASSPGHLEGLLTLGAAVFCPALELRSPKTVVRGAELGDWQAANEALLASVLEDLRASGWTLAG
jgi:hypothetical protein